MRTKKSKAPEAFRATAEMLLALHIARNRPGEVVAVFRELQAAAADTDYPELGLVPVGLPGLVATLPAATEPRPLAAGATPPPVVPRPMRGERKRHVAARLGSLAPGVDVGATILNAFERPLGIIHFKNGFIDARSEGGALLPFKPGQNEMVDR